MDNKFLTVTGYMKYPEKANLERQKVDEWMPGDGN